MPYNGNQKSRKELEHMEKTMGRQVRSGDWVKTLVLTAVVAAMACAATLAVQIPSPTGGYLNLGDAVVLLGAYLLGPGWGPRPCSSRR